MAANAELTVLINSDGTTVPAKVLIVLNERDKIQWRTQGGVLGPFFLLLPGGVFKQGNSVFNENFILTITEATPSPEFTVVGNAKTITNYILDKDFKSVTQSMLGRSQIEPDVVGDPPEIIIGS